MGLLTPLNWLTQPLAVHLPNLFSLWAQGRQETSLCPHLEVYGLQC